MYNVSTTLEDVYRLALPAGTRLIVGADALHRPVSWACSLRPSPPAFPKLEGDELALVDIADLRQLDPQNRLERVVHSLHQARIAAIAVMGAISQKSIAAAQQTGMPLFSLPDGVSLTNVERAIIRLIVDREGHITQRSAELQRELTQIGLDGGGWPEIAACIINFVQQPVVIIRDDGGMIASAGLQELPEQRQQQIVSALPNLTTLRSWAASLMPQDEEDAHSTPVGVLALATGPQGLPYTQVVVAPIVAGGTVRGYCCLLRALGGHRQDPTTVEMIAAQQGAAAAALEWARRNAVDIAEGRMRSTFVDELLASEIADEQAWIQRGRSLGYDLSTPHVAIVCEARGVPEWPAVLVQFIEKQSRAIAFSHRNEGTVLFWPVDNPKSGRELKSVALGFAERLLANHPQARIIMGIGRPATGPGQWLHSLQQARESWRLGKEWQATPVTYFGDLGLYQLLTALSNNAEAARFYRKTLRKLAVYDKGSSEDERNLELLETLETFFACHGNLSQTANRLHIHRNTLTYRLERIAAITQLDLSDPDARFALQLALKLRPVLNSSQL